MDVPYRASVWTREVALGLTGRAKLCDKIVTVAKSEIRMTRYPRAVYPPDPAGEGRPSMTVNRETWSSTVREVHGSR